MFVNKKTLSHLSVMSSKTLHYKSVSYFLQKLKYSSPVFKDFAVIHLENLHTPSELIDLKVTCEFYCIMFNKASSNLGYGGLEYYLNAGALSFVAPNQIIEGKENTNSKQGWVLCFSPKFLKNHSLLEQLHQYPFFAYDFNTALAVNKTDEVQMNLAINRIVDECNQRDFLSQDIICSELELLLKHCLRIASKNNYLATNHLNNDVISSIEKLLEDYFIKELQLTLGLPKINYLSEQLHLSNKYLSSIVHQITGIKTTDYINQFAINKSKLQLLNSNKTVQEIAFETGFSQPHYYTKLFKKYNEITPKAYRNLHQQ
ncbi:hypothetical protein GCM10011397_11370 [Wenyingzhuangia marina]|nr:hypothetical protein GCM10011397_11370 [Wenyingzhuangia marina]